MHSPPSSDAHAACADIILRIQDGDSRARAELFDCLRRKLHWQLRRQHSNFREDLAREVFAETLVEIETGRLSDAAAVLAFASRTSRRLIAELRRAMSGSRPGAGVATESAAPSEPAAQDGGRVAAMTNALRSLLPADLDLLRRYYLLRQSAGEVCAALGISERQFRMRKRHLKIRLTSLVERSMRPRSKGQAV